LPGTDFAAENCSK